MILLPSEDLYDRVRVMIKNGRQVRFMDTYWDDESLSEEEVLRLEQRREKRMQMQREKRLQMQRRKRAKRMIIFGSCFCVFFAVAAALSVLMFQAVGRMKNEKEMMTSWREKESDYTESIEQQEDAVLSEEGQAVSAANGTKDLEEAKEASLGSSGLQGKVEFSDDNSKLYIASENVFSANAILVKGDSIAAGKGEKERISPASMTKVLTILVAAEAMTKDQLEDHFIMTREITDYSYINDCSYVGFLDGEKVKVKDMFYGTILQSGADAAVGLATYVAGSHESFVEKMNEKLEELGIGNTSHFTNCVGLYDKDHYSTVYDMAVIMKATLSNEFCRQVLSARTYTTEPSVEHPEGISISNWFIRRIEDKETKLPVLGAKTGYVNESKSCAVSFAESEEGEEYICVTAGAHSSWRCIYDHVEIYNTY